MTKRTLLAAVRLALGLLTLAAIATQLSRQLDRGASAVNFLSFFTILSNLLGMVVFLGLALTPTRARSHRIDLVRGAAVVYLATTGVVYALLLSDSPEAVALTLPWVNTVLHQLMPIAVVVDWLVDPPTARIAPREAAWWLAFPIVWTVYSLVRGAIVHWYPYPFLDPRLHGTLGVAAYAVGIAVFVGLLIALVAWVGNRGAGRG